jgi:hypothetical protein
MRSYRLLAGHWTVVGTFDAEDDAQAITRARELSQHVPTADGAFAARWGYFRLERRHGYVWEFFFAWVP